MLTARLQKILPCSPANRWEVKHEHKETVFGEEIVEPMIKSAANICGHLRCYTALLKEAYPCALKGAFTSGKWKAGARSVFSGYADGQAFLSAVSAGLSPAHGQGNGASSGTGHKDTPLVSSLASPLPSSPELAPPFTGDEWGAPAPSCWAIHPLCWRSWRKASRWGSFQAVS